MVVVVALERGLLLLNLLSIVIPGLYLGWLATSLFVSRTFFFFLKKPACLASILFSLCGRCCPLVPRYGGNPYNRPPHQLRDTLLRFVWTTSHIKQRVCLNEPFREDALHEEFIDAAIWCVSTFSTQPCLGCVVTANLGKEWS